MKCKRYILSTIALLAVCMTISSQMSDLSVKRMMNSLDNARVFSMSAPERSGRQTLIIVDSQKDFDNIPVSLSSALSSGATDIRITLKKGTYRYSDRHIDLEAVNREKASISIVGEEAVLIPAGNDYVLKPSGRGGLLKAAFNGQYNYKDNFIDDSFNVIDFRDGIASADGQIDIVDKDSKLCRLKTFDPQKSQKRCNDVWVLVTKWYYSRVYKVTRIDRGYVYFTADDLDKDGLSSYNINSDYTYGRISPRYQLINAQSSAHPYVMDHYIYSTGENSIHDCATTSFLTIVNSSLKSFTLTGVRFIGNRDSGWLLNLVNVKSDYIEVSLCTFDGIKSDLLDINNTDNVKFSSNTVRDFYRNGVVQENSSRGTIISDNVFTGNGPSHNQSFAVICSGGDFLVSGNTFSDFSYAAIGAGAHFTVDKENDVTGVIQNNEIFYSGDFFSKARSCNLMDSGAIYVWTQNDNTIIRRNYIHDYTGPKDNRGIFCDDGANEVKIYDNIIIDIPDSYSIDSRKVRSVETRSDSFVKFTNTGNVIYGNILGSPYRIEGRDDNDLCYKGTNYLYYNEGSSSLDNVAKVSRIRSDVKINGLSRLQNDPAVKLWGGKLSR